MRLSDWKGAIVLVSMGLVCSAPLRGQEIVLNEGSTTENLVQLANQNGKGDAEVTARVIGDEFILIEQVDRVEPFVGIPLRTAWYANTQAPVGAEYSVSAEFQPAEISSRPRGGVMGWINLNDSSGIGFQIKSTDDPTFEAPFFQVGYVDFTATFSDDNETTDHLFNTDGSPATFEVGSAQSATTGYDPNQPARVSLEFLPPTQEDEELPDITVTARIMAKVFQGDPEEQVGSTIELLTDRPVPPFVSHRVGYYAYWASNIREGDEIGSFDNLMANGEFEAPAPSEPPVLMVERDGNQLILSWQAPAGSFVLESAESVVATEWTTVPSQGNEATIEMSENLRVFRLRSQ